MKVSDAVAEFLVKQGVEVIFGYQGGAITHLIDSFARKGIRYVQTYNEQGAALAADAYARVSELGFGVAIATNGPGATNLITGIANAYCDSVPVLYLTGQVHTFAMKKYEDVRQESFQEIDILSIVKPIVKYAVTVMEKEQVIPELEKALKIAREGRQGPVLVDLPVDVQGYDIEIEDPEMVFQPVRVAEGKTYYPKEVQKVLGILEKAERPVILAGGGIRCARASGLLENFVESSGIPVVCSLLGLDAISHLNKNFVGFIGSYGNRYANLVIQNADAILVLGSRLDMRQTGKRKDLFAPNAKVVHIDIDQMELGHFIKEEYSVCANVKDFLGELLSNNLKIQTNKKWIKQIEDWKRQYPDCSEFVEKKDAEADLNPNGVMRLIGQALPKGGVVCADVGQNQMWLAQSLRGDSLRILNSGGLGTMGYSLPAAIGAQYATPNVPIFAVMGDGGLQMNIQELQVVGQHQLPIALFVMNNHALGLIRDVHEKYYAARYVGSVEGFSLPDLELLSKSYRLNYYKAETEMQVSEILENIEMPALVEVIFDGNTYVRPELLGNDGLENQFPYKG